MESKTADIVKFIIENPTMKYTEIAKNFNISRQRISQIIEKHLPADEKDRRKKIKIDALVEEVEPLVKVGASIKVISALTGRPISAITAVLKDSRIQAILQESENTKMQLIEQLSVDWLNNLTIGEIIKKYEFNKSQQTVAGMISELRVSYPDKFPLRIHNQESPIIKRERFEELKNQAIPMEEIAKILKYRNVQSMKSSFNQI